MTSEESPKTKSDFMAAEEITRILHGRDLTEQERIIRWVCESLGLAVPMTRDRSPATGPALRETPPVDASVPTRSVDIRTFVQEKQPKSDVQFVAVVAHYHRFIAPEAERKDRITTEDLQTAARLSQRPVFKTPSVPLNNSVQQGYLDRAGRGAYRLNAVGENLVAMTLPGGAEAAASPRRRGSRKKPVVKAKAPRKLLAARGNRGK